MSNQSEAAYRQIKEMILHMELLPGTRIPEVQIASRLSISRWRVALSTLTSSTDCQRRARRVAEVPDMAMSRMSWVSICFMVLPS